jgi:hypothetical protein
MKQPCNFYKAVFFICEIDNTSLPKQRLLLREISLKFCGSLVFLKDEKIIVILKNIIFM